MRLKLSSRPPNPNTMSPSCSFSPQATTHQAARIVVGAEIPLSRVPAGRWRLQSGTFRTVPRPSHRVRLYSRRHAGERACIRPCCEVRSGPSTACAGLFLYFFVHQLREFFLGGGPPCATFHPHLISACSRGIAVRECRYHSPSERDRHRAHRRVRGDLHASPWPVPI